MGTAWHAAVAADLVEAWHVSLEVSPELSDGAFWFAMMVLCCPFPVKISSLAPSWPWAPGRNCRASRVAARNPAMTSCLCFAAHLWHFCRLLSLAPVIRRAGSPGEIHNDSSVAFDVAVGFALAGVPCTATSHFCPVVSAGALPPRSSSCFTKALSEQRHIFRITVRVILVRFVSGFSTAFLWP